MPFSSVGEVIPLGGEHGCYVFIWKNSRKQPIRCISREWKNKHVYTRIKLNSNFIYRLPIDFLKIKDLLDHCVFQVQLASIPLTSDWVTDMRILHLCFCKQDLLIFVHIKTRAGKTGAGVCVCLQWHYWTTPWIIVCKNAAIKPKWAESIWLYTAVQDSTKGMLLNYNPLL